MPNEIIEKIGEFGEAVTQMREKYDGSLEKLENDQKARAKELEIESDKWNTKIDKTLEELGNLKDQHQKDQTRIEILEALTDRPKGTPTEQMEQKHLQTWVKYARGGMTDNRLKNECEELATKIMESKAGEVSIGTALLGGNAVPTVISTSIEELVLAQSQIVENVKNVQAGTSDYNELVTIRGANGGFVGEAGSRTQTTSPNTRKVTITHGELYAYPKVSNWALNDIFFDVVNWLQNDIAETTAVTLSTSIYSGNGSDNLTGMTNSAPTNEDDTASPIRLAAEYEYIPVTGSPNTVIVGDDLIDLQVAVKSRYQGNAKFAMNSVTKGQVRKIKDTTNQYIWQPNYQAGAPETLLGKPLFTWEDLPTPAANALSVAYGDFSRGYLLARIGPMGMVRDEVTAPGYVNFFTYQRYGGIPLNNDAVKFLKMASS